MDLSSLLSATPEEQYDLFAGTVNPQLARVLRTIGFNRQYVRGEGAYLWDSEGHKYLDCLSGYGVFNMGRNHPRIKAALKEAIDRDLPGMIQMDAPLLAGRLARRLLQIVNVEAIDRVFFTNSGTEAVEGAIKFARCATGRPRVIHCRDAFHGLTNGALSCNGIPDFREGFEPLFPGFDAVPFGDLDALEAELRRRDVAGFIVEPIQGKGVYMAPDDYFDQAVRLCRKYGALFIADEVQVGLGRTGKWFACHHWQERPDIITTAKALSGGFVPVGAICYPDWVCKKVFSSMERCVVHSNTFGRNPLAMVAGLAALETIEQEKLVENAARQGQALLEGLKAIGRRHEMVREVRGRGCIVGIEFDRPQSFMLRTGWDLIQKVNKGLFGQLITVPLLTRHRILSQVAGKNTIIKLLPTLTLTDEDVRWILDAMQDVIAECHKFPGSAWDVGKELAKRAVAA
ncbi:MAG TPA: aspartate aminotransferase family protein [Methylomirabilota bacterium]|nr:aspartate aminotransferase family protein [Methylomirabilota bacterium]